MTENLETKTCIWKEVAEVQRESELKYGFELNGTKQFEQSGCYICTGNNTKCEDYMTND